MNKDRFSNASDPMRRLYIPPMLMLYCAAVMLMLYFFVPSYNRIPAPLNFTGILVSIFGIALMGKVRDAFKQHNNPLDIRKSQHMVTEGVFSWSRNPMYIGMCLIVTGFAIISTNVLTLLMPVIFLILVRFVFIPKEETILYETFGEEYLTYKKAVRRWL